MLKKGDTVRSKASGQEFKVEDADYSNDRTSVQVAGNWLSAHLFELVYRVPTLDSVNMIRES